MALNTLSRYGPTGTEVVAMGGRGGVAGIDVHGDGTGAFHIAQIARRAFEI